MSYIGNQPVLQSTQFRDEFFPTSNQTVFTTGGFHPSSVNVTRNGVLLSESDYTKGSDNVTITLNNAAVSGDVIVIYGNRSLAQGVSVSESRVEYTWQANDTVVQLNADVIPAYTDVYVNGIKLWYGDGSGDGTNSDYSIDAALKQVSFFADPAVGDVIAVVHKNEASALVALPLKDSAGNNVLSEANNQVTATNVAISGAGYKPAEVWLSTTTINSATTYIDLPSGYSSYSLRGTDIFFSESGDTTGRISLIFQYGSYTDDSALYGVTVYTRIDAANNSIERYTGRLQLAENTAGESYDNLNFIGWMHDLTTPNRTRAYSAHFLTEYGHNDAIHSYMYRIAGRSETTDVITRLKITMTTNAGSVVAPYGGKVVLTGMTG